MKLLNLYYATNNQSIIINYYQELIFARVQYDHLLLSISVSMFSAVTWQKRI